MSTYLDAKNATANVLGRTDGATASTLRDNAINNVVRFEIADAYPFTWLVKESTSSTDASGYWTLPTDYNPMHRIKQLRRASDDALFQEINPEQFPAYGEGDLKYYIDANAGSYRLVTTEISTSLTGLYYHRPAAMTLDADVIIVPDLDCIAFLAAARYWLSSERDETNHDRFKRLGQERLGLLIQMDKRQSPRRSRLESMFTRDLGWNRRGW